MVSAFKEHVSLAEARQLILDTARDLSYPKTVRIAVEEGLGLILAEDVLSRRNVPHYVASAVDGYALTAASTSRATPATPIFPDARAFLWINTGGPVPDWCDAVVMVEDTYIADNGSLAVTRSLPPGGNIRAVGEDVMRGQVLARRGERMGPALLALLLSAGVATVLAFKKPRCLFIPTGDEICAMKEWVEDDRAMAGKVPESNSSLLKAIFSEWGFDLEVHSILPDSAELIRGVLKQASRDFDLVLVGAGTAKGKRDHTAEVLLTEGQILFRWVRMKPGRPAILARVGGAMVIGMPGFPMSTAVVAWSLAFPALSALSGRGFDPADASLAGRALGALQNLECEMLLPHSSPPGVEEWLRVKAAEIDGKRVAWSLSSGASTMWAMHEADGFMILPPAKVECPKGTRALAWFTREVNWEKRALFQGSDDPAFSRIVTPVRERGADLSIRAVGSLGGLAALSRGEAHLAACHLLDGKTGRYNDSFIEEFSRGQKWARILLFYREQGFLVEKGNPKSFSGLADLAGEGIRIVNRQPGAGTRVLLDWLLEEAGIDSSGIAGYSTQAMTHLDAASRVASGVADAALGIRSAADAFGLDFVSVGWEPFELVLPAKNLSHPGVMGVMEAIRDSGWRNEVEKMGGYRWPD